MAKRFFPLYNIDQPVGPGKPNKHDDVRLVQALFIEVSRFDANDWLRDVPAQARSLTTSGLFDDTLKQWILAFQRWAVKNFGGGDNFTASGHESMGIDIDLPGLLNVCLEENSRRMARYDARLVRPRIMPRLVRMALPFLPKK